MSNVGDLGRRVLERRRELGLSSQEVAVRAGMDPAYFEKLEARAAPQLARGGLVRLAVALETTVQAISGAGTLAPPGQRDPAGRPVLAPLDHSDCHTLISPGGVGRVVFAAPRGPVALPVNFRMLDGDVVFKTAPMPALASALERGTVSFEVDRIDEALVEGWSVLLSGRGHLVVDPKEREQVEKLGVAPWAGGERDTYVRIVPAEVTGRRIRRG